MEKETADGEKSQTGGRKGVDWDKRANETGTEGGEKLLLGLDREYWADWARRLGAREGRACWDLLGGETGTNWARRQESLREMGR